MLKFTPHPLAIYEVAGATTGGLGFWRGMGGGDPRFKPLTHLRYFPGSSHFFQVRKVTHKPLRFQPEVHHHRKLGHTRMFPGKLQVRPEWHPVNLSDAGVFLRLNSCVCFLFGRKLSFRVVNETA